MNRKELPIKKTIIAAGITLLCLMLVIPVLAVRFAPPDSGMAIMLLLFLCGDPLAALVLGILSGAHLPRLWWMPLAVAGSFFLGFTVAVWEIVWDVLFYAGIYLGISAISMFLSYPVFRYLQNR